MFEPRGLSGNSPFQHDANDCVRPRTDVAMICT
jgi:hypothetical protein